MLDAARHWSLFVAGGLLLKAGKERQALATLQNAVALNPDHALTQSSLAIALLKLGRWEEAAAAFSAAIGLDPRAADSRANLLVSLLHLSRWDEAVIVGRRAIELDPGRVTLHEHVGMALVKLERWEEAAETLRRVIDMNPASAEAATLWHLALLKLERWEEALDALREVVAKQPESAQLHRGMGGILGRLGRWDEAIAATQHALTLDPSHHASYLTLASFLANIRATEGSVKVDRRAAERAPDNAAAQLRLGIGLNALGRWEEAVAALEKGSALAPVDNVFQYLLVDPLLRLGRGKEALEAYRRARQGGAERPRLPGQTKDRLEERQAAFWSRDTLPPEVFAVEEWLGSLATAPAAAADTPKQLFLLDSDFGELTTLMYLLLGRPMFASSTLLLPDRLFEKNPDALKGRTHRYRTVEDVLQVVDRVRPDVVFLCSGYLLTVHQLFTIEELQRLVEALRERGCRVATADPFLGLFSQRAPRDIVSINVPERTVNEEVTRQLMELKKKEEQRLWTNFTAAEKILRDCWHLYPSYCDVPRAEAHDADRRNLSFYNDRLVCPVPKTAARTPHWFFVMSQTDYEAQKLFESLSGFLDLVVEKLLQTIAAGRRPILIAPRDLIQDLHPRMPTLDGLDLLSYCPFTQFTSLLLSAEYAFYWNVLSHSILVRLFNGLPTVVFDRGHLIRNVPAMYPRVIQWYYQGWEPALMDHRTPLTLDAVKAWAEPYFRAADDIRRRFQRAPTPEQMVSRAAAGEPGSAA